jgi:hypothetical protein
MAGRIPASLSDSIALFNTLDCNRSRLTRSSLAISRTSTRISFVGDSPVNPDQFRQHLQGLEDVGVTFPRQGMVQMGRTVLPAHEVQHFVGDEPGNWTNVRMVDEAGGSHHLQFGSNVQHGRIDEATYDPPAVEYDPTIHEDVESFEDSTKRGLEWMDPSSEYANEPRKGYPRVESMEDFHARVPELMREARDFGTPMVTRHPEMEPHHWVENPDHSLSVEPRHRLPRRWDPNEGGSWVD